MKIIQNSFSNKKQSVLLLAFILISIQSVSQINLQNGLVAQYLFNQNANDSGSNSLNATLHGSLVFVDDRNGTPNSAISLDGIDDYVKIVDNSQFNFGSGDFSISFWVNKQALSANTTSFYHTYGANQWKTGGATSGQNEWSLAIANTSNADFPLFSIESGTNLYSSKASSELVADKWYHLVGVRDGNQLLIYLDGILSGTKVIPNNTIVNNTGNDLIIGNGNDFNFSSKAYFDDLLIYDRALNSTEVAELFQPTSSSLWTNNVSNIYYDGKVAVNTLIVPDGYEFAVNGAAIMEEVKVQLKEEWPDYVFEPSYNLPSHAETKKFIHENKHLKGIPSAKEVAKNGVDLGKMNAILLEKIEELTLHQIKLMELLKQQQSEINELKIKH